MNLDWILVLLYKKTFFYTVIALFFFCLPPSGLAWFGHSRSIWEKIAHHQQLLKRMPRHEITREVMLLLRSKSSLEKMSQNARLYLPYLYKTAKQKGLPPELALLPIIESHYDPFSYSWQGATGLWQMMPGTAAGYGLTLDWWYDGRRDTVASTEAALNYLAYLHDYFHDWLLAIAAYNAGEGRILKAIHANIRQHKPIDYWSLKLPKQTTIYVPRFLAYLEIISHAKDYGLHLSNPPEETPWRSFALPAPMHLSQVAHLAGIPLSTLRRYNPGFRRDITGPHIDSILIPVSAAQRMQEQLRALLTHSKQSFAHWIRHKVRRGDTLGRLARRYKTTPELIRTVNHFKGNVIGMNQLLLIPTHRKKLQVALSPHHRSQIKRNTISESRLPGPTQIRYRVRRGDTLKRIARRFGFRESQIVYWNALSWGKPLKTGKILNLWRRHHRHHQKHYRVKPGDTLAKIAARHHTTIRHLKRINHLKNDRIKSHQRLKI